MIFRETEIGGVFVIAPEPHEDERGMLRRHFCRREFSEHGLEPEIAQCNISENRRKLTLRGFHYQLPPDAEAKTISCFRGAVHDVVVDLRPESTTYMKWISLELSAQNRLAVHLSAGCANAFLTLSDDTWIHYYHSRPYSKGADRGVRYNDPRFGFRWPADPAVISEKDRSFPDFVPERRSAP